MYRLLVGLWAGIALGSSSHQVDPSLKENILKSMLDTSLQHGIDYIRQSQVKDVHFFGPRIAKYVPSLLRSNAHDLILTFPSFYWSFFAKSEEFQQARQVLKSMFSDERTTQIDEQLDLIRSGNIEARDGFPSFVSSLYQEEQQAATQDFEKLKADGILVKQIFPQLSIKDRLHLASCCKFAFETLSNAVRSLYHARYKSAWRLSLLKVYDIWRKNPKDEGMISFLKQHPEFKFYIDVIREVIKSSELSQPDEENPMNLRSVIFKDDNTNCLLALLGRTPRIDSEVLTILIQSFPAYVLRNSCPIDIILVAHAKAPYYLLEALAENCPIDVQLILAASSLSLFPRPLLPALFERLPLPLEPDVLDLILEFVPTAELIMNILNTIKPGSYTLSDRQLSKFLDRGLSNRQIADILEKHRFTFAAADVWSKILVTGIDEDVLLEFVTKISNHLICDSATVKLALERDYSHDLIAWFIVLSDKKPIHQAIRKASKIAKTQDIMILLALGQICYVSGLIDLPSI